MKKTIIALFIVISFNSCDLNSVPECGDKEVTDLAIELLNEQVKEKLKEEYVAENFHRYDAIEYANNKGWDADDYVQKEEKRIDIEADKHAEKTLIKTRLKNIRSTSIDKDIKLCNCSADVENIGLNKIEVDYTAQRTEDKDQAIYVELSYTIK